MATSTIPIISTTVQSDTNATNNTIVQRDNAGGIYGQIVQGSDLVTTGYLTGTPITKTSSFTAGAATDYLCDCTSGAITVTLPLASANAGVIYYFTKKDSSGNTVTLTGVDGTGTISSQYVSVRVFTDGTNWYSH